MGLLLSKKYRSRHRSKFSRGCVLEKIRINIYVSQTSFPCIWKKIPLLVGERIQLVFLPHITTNIPWNCWFVIWVYSFIFTIQIGVQIHALFWANLYPSPEKGSFSISQIRRFPCSEGSMVQKAPVRPCPLVQLCKYLLSMRFDRQWDINAIYIQIYGRIRRSIYFVTFLIFSFFSSLLLSFWSSSCFFILKDVLVIIDLRFWAFDLNWYI